MGTTPVPLLVTGASGFVGARVVRMAIDRGHPVTALVGPQSSVDRLLPLLRDIELVRADIADAAAVQHAVSTARPVVCVHLAAVGAVVLDDDLEGLLSTNAVAPVLLARALARAGGRRLVTAGSSSEYGTVDGAMEESMAADPDDFYGVAKLAGGLLARIVGVREGLETVHLRLFSVYGPGEDPRRLVASVVDSLLAGRPISLTPGDQVRDFVYVDDVAEALLEAACRPRPAGTTVNVGTGVQTTVRELCSIVADLVGGHDLLRFGERAYRPGERFSWRASTALAEQTLAWHARTSLRAGLALTVEQARRDRLAEVAA